MKNREGANTHTHNQHIVEWVVICSKYIIIYIILYILTPAISFANERGSLNHGLNLNVSSAKQAQWV